MNPRTRTNRGFITGSLVGALGGLIGLGGAEFRLPILVGLFRLSTLEAVILNKAMSLAVVGTALIFRTGATPLPELAEHGTIVLNLLAGSLVGAWWAAGHAMTMSRAWLDRIILVTLAALAILMLLEAWAGAHQVTEPLFQGGFARFLAGVVAGLGIGVVAALLGVAGGELLIPTIVILYGVDVKLAGSLSLMVSLPTMIVGFTRYSRSSAFDVLRREQPLFRWMLTGSILGAGIGGLLLGMMPTRLLLGLLGIILLVSAAKTFKHTD